MFSLRLPRSRPLHHAAIPAGRIVPLDPREQAILDQLRARRARSIDVTSAKDPS